MMNNTLCTTPATLHRELRFGPWKVSIDRSPERICERLTDFAVGMRWAAMGLVAGLAAIAATAL
jgi:hypothetical protein